MTGRHLAACLAALALSGCLRDFTLPPRREGGAVDRVAAEARDRDGKDRSSDVPATDLVTPPDQGCPSPCVTTFAGTNQFGVIDGPLSQARFRQPTSITVHGQDALLVADPAAAKIRRIAAGQVVTYAGTGGWGHLDGSALLAAFYFPHDVAVDGQTVYVAEPEYLRGIANGLVTTIAGGQSGLSDGPVATALFADPHGMAPHATLGLLIADWGNNRIRRLLAGQVSTLAGGDRGYVDGAAATAKFSGPVDVAVDSSGAVYVTDSSNSCIRRIAGGQVTTFAGQCGSGGFADGPAATASFLVPSGIAVEASGALLVADTWNDRIRRIAGGFVSTVAGSLPGYQDGPAATAQFNRPLDVTVDASGAIYVADANNFCIRRIQ